MFTGIVVAQGRLERIERSPGGSILTVKSAELAARLRVGDSVSVDGICLTVVESTQQLFRVEVTPETLRLTNLPTRKEGDRVNLEPAARMNDFLSGHLVQGHVDVKGQITDTRVDGNSKVFRFQAPASLLRYCTLKGSITVNGVSLTISGLGKEWFEVTIIPHTLEVTNFGQFKMSDVVNLEVDIISKYVELHVKRVLVSFAAILMATAGWLQASSFNVDVNTILIYENTTRANTSQTVIRVARYQPDIVMEWETRMDQGTVHLYRKAVDQSTRFTLAGLFKVGVNSVSKDETTVWLSRTLYDQLATGKTQKIHFNRTALKMTPSRREDARILVNGEKVVSTVVVFKDDRRGEWAFLDERENPLLIKYSSPFYVTELSKVVNPEKASLRWIKNPPPIQ
jgi:riboflavin synthase